jgi:hypothetical protein
MGVCEMVGSVKQSAPQAQEKKDTYAGAFDPKLNKIVQVEIKNIGKDADGKDNFAIKTKNGKMIPLDGIHNQADAKKQAQMQINGGELFRVMGQGYAWGTKNFSEDLAKQVKDAFLAKRPSDTPVAKENNQVTPQNTEPKTPSVDSKPDASGEAQASNPEQNAKSEGKLPESTQTSQDKDTKIKNSADKVPNNGKGQSDQKKQNPVPPSKTKIPYEKTQAGVDYFYDKLDEVRKSFYTN